MLKTKLGRWSVWLCGLFLSCVSLAKAILMLGESRGAMDLMPTIPSTPNHYVTFFAIFLLLGLLLGILSFVTGLISVLRFKERSWLISISLFISLFAVILVLLSLIR